jgi:ATP/maltotriose-dependent transcriptional regulator MalT
VLLVFLGGLQGMLGRFDEGRALIGRARVIYDELRDVAAIARVCSALGGQVEALAGDFAAAERVWREGCDILEGLGDVSFLASHMAELADVLCAQGRYAEADEYSNLAEERAAGDDIYTQILWRIPRSKVAAQQRDRTRAESLAEEAVELASKTDALVISGRARLALAEVLGLEGRFREAVAAARAALDAFREKGDVVSARSARAVIRRLEAEGALPEMATV